MNTLLNLIAAVSVETLGFGGQIVVIGIATVFAVLTILLFALKLFEIIFSGSSQKKSDAAPKEAAPAPVYAADDAEEIVAVIAAAIAAAEAEAPTLKFKVVSFRRK